jgi:mono/diheme cytochrome c family protein
MKKILYILSALLLTTIFEVFGSDDWPVPAEYANLENPVVYNNQNVREGRDIWDKNCKSCHGDPGKYNALALVPPPPDASSDLMQEHTDGELFFKVTYGRGAMPQFETTLSTDDRWKVVTFIRRFDPRNAGLLADEELLKGKIYALVGNNNTSIDIVAELQNKSGQMEKLSENTIYVMAQKTFGNMLVGTVNTDNEGRASFNIPGDMHTKTDGKVDFVLTLGDDFEPTTFAISGVQVRESRAFEPPPRVLWSTNDRTQAWLLATYFAALIGAWSTIGYIIWQIVKIWKLGQNN